jgi:LPXTG-motif cell wall-anchored protein
MRKITSAVGALLLILGFGMLLASPAQATGGGSEDNDKRWVCKYVGTPGEDERLKDGKNPISVDSSATVGSWFNDAQGRSFVLAIQTEENTGPGNTYKGNLTCPEPEGPTPTPTPTPTETSATPTPTPTETTPTPTPTETTETPTPTPTDSTTPPPSGTPTSTPPAPAPPELPKTGAPAPLLAGLGTLLAALGAGAMFLGRKPGLHE